MNNTCEVQIQKNPYLMNLFKTFTKIFKKKKKSNGLLKAEKELEILSKSCHGPNDRPILEPFYPEVLALVKKFSESGQSGGSAPFTAQVISSAVKKLCLHQPICPITGIDEEWQYGMCDGTYYQNLRLSSIFKETKEGKAYYLDAVIFQGEDRYDTFTGSVEDILSRQYIKSFPFEPKTFYIDVVKVPYNKQIHKENYCVRCNDGDYVYSIKDRNQLIEVFNYYDKFEG